MMRKATWITLAVLLGLGASAWWWRGKSDGRRTLATPPVLSAKDSKDATLSSAGETPAMPAAEAQAPRPVLDKWAQVARIRKDYDELAEALGEEFTAAGDEFLGGLNAYLRQLELLARESRADVAAVLTPEEFAEWEMKETMTGKKVERGLEGVAVTDEQRRAVFHLQRAFDEKYGFALDLRPEALVVRETERQQLQESILGQLGPEAFAKWLDRESPEFAHVREFVVSRGLPPEQAIELWRVKNEFVRANLGNRAVPGVGDEQVALQRAALAETAKARIETILGAGAVERAGAAAFPWLVGGN